MWRRLVAQTSCSQLQLQACSRLHHRHGRWKNPLLLTGPRDQGPVFQINSGAPVPAGGKGAICTMQRDRRSRQGDDGYCILRGQQEQEVVRSMAEHAHDSDATLEIRYSILELDTRYSISAIRSSLFAIRARSTVVAIKKYQVLFLTCAVVAVLAGSQRTSVRM